mmetsp:Transcript_22363/g.60447  ORF Transcript_22363/g.60447 Transcript_22363/m.60447 type:complete len:239 (+) Transcript_22363:1649-2365(+)
MRGLEAHLSRASVDARGAHDEARCLAGEEPQEELVRVRVLALSHFLLALLVSRCALLWREVGESLSARRVRRRELEVEVIKGSVSEEQDALRRIAREHGEGLGECARLKGLVAPVELGRGFLTEGHPELAPRGLGVGEGLQLRAGEVVIHHHCVPLARAAEAEHVGARLGEDRARVGLVPVGGEDAPHERWLLGEHGECADKPAIPQRTLADVIWTRLLSEDCPRHGVHKLEGHVVAH